MDELLFSSNENCVYFKNDLDNNFSLHESNSKRIKITSQSSEFKNRMECCFFDSEFSDVEFNIITSNDKQGRVRFYASKLILAQWSPVLRDEFRKRKNPNKTITIYFCCQAFAFQAFLQFIHFGKIDLDSILAKHVLTIAKCFQVQELEEICSRIISQSPTQISSLVPYHFPAKFDFLSSLPIDLIVTIAKFLHPRDIYSFIRVNRRINQLFQNETLWKSFYSSIFGKPPLPMNPSTSWKQQFRITAMSQFSFDMHGTGLCIQGNHVFRKDFDGLALGNLAIDLNKGETYEWVLKIDGLKDYVYTGIARYGILSRMSCSVNNKSSAQFAWVYKYTGMVMDHEKENKVYSQPWQNGDEIGVRVEGSSRSITFFKNGVNLGKAFENLPLSEPLYPILSLGNSNVVARLISP